MFSKQNKTGSLIRLFIIFVTVFLIFHGTGAVVSDLPYVLNALITFPVVLIILLISDKWYSNVTFPQVFFSLGFHGTSFKKLFPGILISFSLLLLYPLFHFITGSEIFLNGSWMLNLAGLFLTGGLAEEIFFRGFLFRHLRESMTFKKATLTSMIMFTAAHLMMFTYMDLYVALFSTILAVMISIPLSFLFERSDNTVWSPALVHTTIRTIGLVVTSDENIFMQLTLYWMTGCMILPLLIVLFNKNFREMWKGSSHS